MEVTIELPREADRVALFGPAERNLKMIREALGVKIAARDRALRVRGDHRALEAAQTVFHQLLDASERRTPLSRHELMNLLAEASSSAAPARALLNRPGAPDAPAPTNGETPTGVARVIHDADDPAAPLDVFVGGRRVEPRTPNQKLYLDAIRAHDLVFASGPAGTGKTYLAVASAIHLLKVGRVKKAILARPAVEAGEKLGYLPGDQYAKLNPYLRPLLDALHDMVDYATIKRFMAADVVEIVPLAYMRGRTLNDAVIILDEAQNATRGQMQMFLTRMGQRSKTIVTGDTTQVDLPDPTESGLVDAVRRLRRVKGVAAVALQRADVVRHSLVQRIIDAYGPGPDGAPARGSRSDG